MAPTAHWTGSHPDYDIYKAGGVILRDRKFLLGRSKGKTLFINPGGKLEPGETPEQALIREVREELGIVVHTGDLRPYGTYYAIAAGHKDTRLRMDMFIIESWEGEPRPDNEIEEIRWFDSTMNGQQTGSILEHEVIPKLKAERLID